MPPGRKYVTYYRVSTARQGRSGLGLDAQKKAVDDYLRKNARVLGSYTEIESGKNNNRPELQKALAHCRNTGATLVIAKLDRLSRDAHFLLGLKKAEVDFVAADMPDANRLTVGIMALVAEQEREAISKRTREALQAAKRRGVKLGNPNGAKALRRAGKGNKAAVAVIRKKADELAKRLGPVVASSDGKSLRQIAAELNEAGIETARGGRWYASSVRSLLERVELVCPPVNPKGKTRITYADLHKRGATKTAEGRG
jgi:DNA invertase Pin-like site-specific DNA recombinase